MKSALLLFRDLSLRLADSVVAAVVRPPDSAVKNVLVIRLDKLGDYVVWLDSARHLCTELQQRGRRVTLLANEEWAALARSERCFDEVWDANVRKLRRNLGYRAQLISRIRRRGYESVYSPRVAKERGLEDFIVRASAARERIGVSGIAENIDPERLRRAERVYTRVVHVAPTIQSERIRNEYLLRQLGHHDYRASLPRYVLDSPLPPSIPAVPYAVIVPGGGWSGRRWPTSRFAEVVEHLWIAHNLRSVIMGAPSERELGDDLARATRTAQPTVLVGQLGLADLPAVLAAATVVLTNETGPAHLAVACGTNTVCITGGGHFGRFVPDPLVSTPTTRPQLRVVNVELPCYGCNWHCPFITSDDAAAPCISEVSVPRVIDAVDEILAAQLRVDDNGALNGQSGSESPFD